MKPDEPTDPAEQLVRELLVEHSAASAARGVSIGVSAGTLIGSGLPASQRRVERASARAARRNRWITSRLGESHGEQTIDSALPAAASLQQARTLLESIGRIYQGELPPMPTPEVWGLISAGLMDSGLVVVRIAALDRSGGGSTVTIRATALEGLIKARYGEKLAARVKAQLEPLLAAR